MDGILFIKILFTACIAWFFIGGYIYAFKDKKWPLFATKIISVFLIAAGMISALWIMWKS